MHLAVSVFRCVENRVPLARAVNTGISALVDGNGRIVQSLPKLNEGVLTVDVPLDDRARLYPRWGDWLGLDLPGPDDRLAGPRLGERAGTGDCREGHGEVGPDGKVMPPSSPVPPVGAKQGEWRMREPMPSRKPKGDRRITPSIHHPCLRPGTDSTTSGYQARSSRSSISATVQGRGLVRWQWSSRARPGVLGDPVAVQAVDLAEPPGQGEPGEQELGQGDQVPGRRPSGPGRVARRGRTGGARRPRG